MSDILEAKKTIDKEFRAVDLSELTKEEQSAIKRYMKVNEMLGIETKKFNDKIDKLTNEFNKKHSRPLESVKNLQKKVSLIIENVENNTISVDDTIRLHLKIVTKASHKYKGLFTEALEKVSKKVRKELLDMKEANSTTNTTKNLLIQTTDEASFKDFKGSVKEILRKAISHVKEILFPAVSNIESTQGEVANATEELKALVHSQTE